MFVATLIAPKHLGYGDVHQIQDHLDGLDCLTSEWHWLEEERAADIPFARNLNVAKSELAQLDDIDVFVQAIARREKRLLVADMDSTIIGQECIDELADYAGVKSQVAAITERAMRGELDFAAALKERVALLKGIDERMISECLSERIRINPGAETLVRTMRARGAETILISGGFTAFVEPIARRVGFERFQANHLSVSQGRLCGTTDGRIVDASVKLETLVDARERLGLSKADTLAIGDGANDRLMISEAGMGVAFRAKPALQAVANARLEHNGLSALLWAQGIPRSQWVSA